MKWKITLAVPAVVVVAFTALAAPAQAAPPRIPFTCGMVVTTDATVYLSKNVTCSTAVGIRVTRPPIGDDAPGPKVTIDLNGKTLKGSGAGTGVAAYDSPFSWPITVRNGFIKNWETGVVGSDGMRAKALTFVGNGTGMACGDSGCGADLSAFIGNGTGFRVYADAGGSVTRSTFVGNDVGATTSLFSRLTIDLSSFAGNETGVAADYAVAVSRTAFVKNGTGVRMSQEGPFSGGCPSLTKVAFTANGKNVVGARCAS